MKAVLMSIQPKWCEKIFSEQMTIKVCKTAPKLETPFKVYVYETLGKRTSCRKCAIWQKCGMRSPFGCYEGAGAVVGEFICCAVEKYDIDLGGNYYRISDKDSIQACLDQNLLFEYGNGRDLYGWHISEPKLYDEPKELGEFYTICNKYGDDSCGDCPYLVVEQCCSPCDDCVDTWCSVDNIKPITRPPRGWQYVEEIRDESVLSVL